MVAKRKSEVVEAQDKLEQLLVEQDVLATRIAKQKRVIAALKELSELEEDSGPPVGLVTGITDACRTVLRSAEKPLLPTEVRDRVEHLGIPEQRNLLASVYTVIRRLKEAGDVRDVPPKEDSGPMKYEWVRRGDWGGFIANVSRRLAGEE
jgi:hypothetical protein